MPQHSRPHYIIALRFSVAQHTAHCNVLPFNISATMDQSNLLPHWTMNHNTLHSTLRIGRCYSRFAWWNHGRSSSSSCINISNGRRTSDNLSRSHSFSNSNAAPPAESATAAQPAVEAEPCPLFVSSRYLHLSGPLSVFCLSMKYSFACF